jgi:hypothetical protein
MIEKGVLAKNDRKGTNYLMITLQPMYFVLVDAKKRPLAALISSLAFSSKPTLVLFHNLKSMIMQDCMMGNCRLALIHIWEHHIYINNWIINII